MKKFHWIYNSQSNGELSAIDTLTRHVGRCNVRVNSNIPYTDIRELEIDKPTVCSHVSRPFNWSPQVLSNISLSFNRPYIPVILPFILSHIWLSYYCARKLGAERFIAIEFRDLNAILMSICLFYRVETFLITIVYYTVVSSSCNTWSYSDMATQKIIAVTSSKQWIHFLRSLLWPPTSNNLWKNQTKKKKK